MTLDPDVSRLLDLIRAAGRPPYEALTPAEAREAYRQAREVVAPEPEDVAEIRALSAQGPGGPIALRLYRPLELDAEPVLPGLVYFHGGGWVLGDLDSHDGVCRHLANRAGAIVVSVDYRLAPEHKFPAAVDDALAAARFVSGHAAELGIDPARLAIGGDSAGANLAAVACLLARDAGGPALRFQLLLYPVTDFGAEGGSRERCATGYGLTAANLAWFEAQYLTGAHDRADWRASPLRAPSLAGLPPAFVLTAGHDPLCDEGERYARRLVEAEVLVTSWRLNGQIHGFLPMGRMISGATRALDEIGRALRHGLG